MPAGLATTLRVLAAPSTGILPAALRVLPAAAGVLATLGILSATTTGVLATLGILSALRVLPAAPAGILAALWVLPAAAEADVFRPLSPRLPAAVLAARVLSTLPAALPTVLTRDAKGVLTSAAAGVLPALRVLSAAATLSGARVLAADAESTLAGVLSATLTADAEAESALIAALTPAVLSAAFLVLSAHARDSRNPLGAALAGALASLTTLSAELAGFLAGAVLTPTNALTNAAILSAASVLAEPARIAALTTPRALA